jgi:hypothetical protein
MPYAPGKSFAVLSGDGDEDWYKFSVAEFSRFDLQMNSYPLLGGVSVTLEPDDQSSQAQSELQTVTLPASTRLQGLLAPGGYRLHVRGSVNLYELTVDLKREPLQPDIALLTHRSPARSFQSWASTDRAATTSTCILQVTGTSSRGRPQRKPAERRSRARRTFRRAA